MCVLETLTNLIHCFIQSSTRTETEVLAAARRSLSPHQVPARVHLLPQLPLTIHGKTDLRQLGLLAAQPPDHQGEWSPGEIQEKVREVWESLVSSAPREEENFLSAGGDSFSALALVNTLRYQQPENMDRMILIFSALTSQLRILCWIFF